MFDRFVKYKKVLRFKITATVLGTLLLFPALYAARDQDQLANDVNQEPTRVVEESSVFGKTYNVVYRFMHNFFNLPSSMS